MLPDLWVTATADVSMDSNDLERVLLDDLEDLRKVLMPDTEGGGWSTDILREKRVSKEENRNQD